MNIPVVNGKAGKLMHRKAKVKLDKKERKMK
jgi:hypothetical protein